MSEEGRKEEGVSGAAHMHQQGGWGRKGGRVGRKWASEQARKGAAYLFFISLNEESTILYGE